MTINVTKTEADFIVHLLGEEVSSSYDYLADLSANKAPKADLDDLLSSIKFVEKLLKKFTK